MDSLVSMLVRELFDDEEYIKHCGKWKKKQMQKLKEL